MNEDKAYGFYDEVYEDGSNCKTLMTGDGRTLFTDLLFNDGLVGIGFSYGLGEGVGVKITPPKGTKAGQVGVEFQVKFESQESIDSMIETLLRVKNILSSKGK